MNTTIEQWRMLQAVVEHGSFAKAGEAIHKSQSSIHAAVKKLEQNLGIPLLHTENKTTQLTAAGERLLRRGNLLIEEFERVEQIASELAKGCETAISIAVDSIYPNQLLADAFANTSALFPQVRIELYETILSGSSELLQHGVTAIAIGAEIEGFPAEYLCQCEFTAVAAPNHPLLQHQQLSLGQLKSHRQIVVRDSALQSRTDSGWLNAEQRWTVSNPTTSIELVTQGYGYAWLPSHKIDNHLKEGRLVPLPLGQHGTRVETLFLTIADEDCLGPAAMSLVNYIRSNHKKPV